MGKSERGGTPRKAGGAGKAGQKKTTKAAAKKRGPKSKRTADIDAIVMRVVGKGMSLRTAAEIAGIGERTLKRWVAEDENLGTAIKEARAGAVETYVDSLDKLRKDGHLGAICFWLKTRTEEFRERKSSDANPDPFDVGPLTTVVECRAAAERTVQAMGTGDVSQERGGQILAGIEKVSALIEGSDLEKRVAELESRG